MEGKEGIAEEKGGRGGREEGGEDVEKPVHRLLARFFRRRPPASELHARNVLVAGPEVDPSLHAQRRAQRRTRTADMLSQRLSVRATREELVLRGILPAAAPSALAGAGVPREGAVFGLPPAQLAARYPAMEGGVPAVLWACAEAILADVGAEGLFRVPGAQREVVELRSLVERGCAVNVRAASTVHVLTSFVGAFFRALPEPLLGFDLYDEWLALARRIEDENGAVPAPVMAVAADGTPTTLSPTATGMEAQDIPPPLPATTATTTPETIKALLQQLPRANFILLRWLLDLLHLITLCSEKNRMGARGMGTVFGPTLMRPRTETLESLARAPLHALLAETLVRDYPALFPHDPAEQPPAVLVSTKFPLPALLIGRYTPPCASPPPPVPPPKPPTATPLVPRRPAPAPPPMVAAKATTAATEKTEEVQIETSRDVATQTDFPWLQALYAQLHRAAHPPRSPPRPFPLPSATLPQPVLPQPVLPQRIRVQPPPPRPLPAQHRAHGRTTQRSASLQHLSGDDSRNAKSTFE